MELNQKGKNMMEQIIGTKISAIIAGFIGAIVSLRMIRDLTPMMAITTIIGGTACAAYLTPLVVVYAGLSGTELESALAFLTGFCGMNALAGIFKISERFKANPSINALKKPEDKPND